MRLWVLLLLAVVLVVVVDATRRRKYDDDDDDSLPDLADGDFPDELDADSYDDERYIKKTIKKKTKKRPPVSDIDDEDYDDDADGHKFLDEEVRPNRVDKKRPKSSSEDYVDRKPKRDGLEEDSWEICDEEQDKCICDKDALICDHTMNKDAIALDTLNVYLPAKFHPTTVKVVHNHIKTLKADEVLHKHEGEITDMDLAFNQISFIESETFVPFKKLAKLNLAHNQLKRLRQGWFSDNTELHQLDLSHNKISDIDDGVFDQLPNLKKLALDGNNLELTPDLFKDLHKLEKLSLDNCDLDDNNFPVDLFKYVPNLKQLSLRNNKFTEVPRAVNQLDKLEHLDLSQTNIAELHEQAFKTGHVLQSLYMENMTYLYSVMSCAFCGLGNLTVNVIQMIHMSNNPKLYEFHENAFGVAEAEDNAVTTLEHLYIEDCKLETLSINLYNWKNLKELGIGGNPMQCDCNTAFLLGGKSWTYEYTNNLPKCATPDRLKGEPMAKVDPKEACLSGKFAEARSGSGSGGARAVTVISVFLVVVVVAGVGYWTYGTRIRQLLVRAHPSPPISYSNLNNAEDTQNLESDFEPRAEAVSDNPFIALQPRSDEDSPNVSI